MRVVVLSLIFAGMLSFGVACSDSAAPEEGTTPELPRYSESLVFNSKLLNRPVRYSVYLPADYVQSGSDYGTVYLLHGYGDNEKAWIKDGRIDRLTEKLETAGKISPMIYIMPQGWNSYYVDCYNGYLDYMRMFTEELVPLVDSVYRTRRQASQRAVVGYSMGGYGALILPSKHPELFSVSVPLSMSFRTDEQYMAEPQEGFDRQWGAIFGGKGTAGEARLTDYFKEHSPFYFFDNGQAAEMFERVHYFLDCGDDEESLSETNDALHVLMRERTVEHEYRVRNGAHTWNYWNRAMEEALAYIEACFTGKVYPEETVKNYGQAFQGIYQKETLAGQEVGVWLPVDYETSGENYPVVYCFHQWNDWEGSDVRQLLGVLDSLHRIKSFILVEAEAEKNEVDEVIAFMDRSYRTLPEAKARIGIGNKEGGRKLYDASWEQAALQTLFLFDPALESDFSLPSASFYYLDMTDEGIYYTAVNRLYLLCRRMGINHQYRVRNGKDSFPSFLQGVKESVTYIGLMLNNL